CRAVIPGESYALVRRGTAHIEIHFRESCEQLLHWHRERLAFVRFVSAAATLSLVAQSANALVTDGHHLTPPIGRAGRGDVSCDLAMRLVGGAHLIEGLDPLRPRAAGRFLDGGVAHPGELREVRFLFPDELKTRGGVRLARLFHA